MELREFVGRNGRIRLVVGCLVSKSDIEALIQQGLAEDEAEKVFLKGEFLRRLDEIEKSDSAVAQAFARLVAAGVAELRFAFRKDGIYHEKFGIFEDKEGVKIAFIGSINETASALTHGVNHESFSVYQSTEPMFYAAYGCRLEEKFEELWNGRTLNTRIVPLDEESLERIKAMASKIIDEQDEPTSTDTDQRLPATFSLRPYQLDAIKAWQDQGFKGILSMATGTGKTLTAIAAVKLVKAKIPGAAIVITVPLQNLAVQWLEALRDQGLDAFGVFDNHANWYDRVKTQFSAARYSEAAPMACLVCVNASFKDERFQDLVGLLEHSKEANHLLVVDECHHFNKQEHIGKLSNLFTLRLGLSATPYDQFSDDDEGQHLARYFGKIAFEFPLGRAIQEGFLTQYRYHMFYCSLDDEETDRYAQLTHEIIKIAGSDERFSPQTLAKVQPKLLARARIVGAAKDKLRKLHTHLDELGRTPYTLFYCGDGAVEDEGEWSRQIEVVSQMLHQLGWRTSRITADESLKTREQLLNMLTNRSIDAVVSIKVLDEGIDIPACQSAYLLASKSSNRQWIQRRGRVLRLSEGKEMADIYDFLVLGGTSEAKTFKSLAKKELKRAQQFGIDAFNAANVMKQLSQIQDQLGITIEGQTE